MTSMILCRVALATILFFSFQDLKQDMHRDRWMWQLPWRVINMLDVKPGMVIADVGAGEGYFTFRLAQRVGEYGKIYANDIDKDKLSVIQKRCEEDGIKNVTTILGQKNDPLLPQGEMDLVLMVNLFNYLENPELFLRNIKNSLKSQARMVFIQWDS